MKAYVIEKSQKNEDNVMNENESFEDIDSTKKNDEDDQNNQFIYNLNINSSEVCKKCDIKRKTFKSNNAFHAHIRECSDDEKLNLSESKFEDLSIIESHAKIIIHKRYDFKSYQYVIAWMRISLTKSVIEEVIDIECVMFLVDIKYLILILLKVTIVKMSTLINVRDINNALHQSSFYVMIDLYLNDLTHESKARDHIRREFHLIDELNASF
jgi:hypothetical protein